MASLKIDYTSSQSLIPNGRFLTQPLPFAKRTAFDSLGHPVEGALPQGLSAQLGLPDGKMLLLNGFENNKSGFGLAHIEAKPQRMKQFVGLGYKTAHRFVRDVFENYSMIGLEENARLAIIYERGADFLFVFCHWDEALQVWSVTTALPKRHKRGVNVVWTRGRGEETA